jgi:hypothetical protein
MLLCSALEALRTGGNLGSLFGAMTFFLQKRRKGKRQMANERKKEKRILLSCAKKLLVCYRKVA